MGSAVTRVTMRPEWKQTMKKDRKVAQTLRPIAEQAARNVNIPLDLRVYGFLTRQTYKVSTRAGVGPRGAFAQVIMSGPRAIAIEFGTRKRAALAPLRRAIFGMRGW